VVNRRSNLTPVLPHLRMLLSLDGYSSDCRPVRGCVIARQRGQTRLGRQPALDVRAVRIENRWHSDALLYGLCMRRWMMRCSPKCTSLPSLFANAAAFIFGAGRLAAAASLPARAPT